MIYCDAIRSEQTLFVSLQLMNHTFRQVLDSEVKASEKVAIFKLFQLIASHCISWQYGGTKHRLIIDKNTFVCLFVIDIMKKYNINMLTKEYFKRVIYTTN